MWGLVLELLLKEVQLCNRILIWTLGIETTVFFQSGKIAKIEKYKVMTLYRPALNLSIFTAASICR